MIRSKSEFLEAWGAGLLGNKLRTWPSIDDVAGYDGAFSIRSRRPGSRNTMYGVRREGVPDAIARLARLGDRPADLYFGEMAPDHRLLAQGEYLDGIGGINQSFYNRYLMYSREQVPMKRVGLWSHLEGAATVALLRSAMTPGSWDDFQALQGAYPGHVIELGIYECHLGDIPGRNCIIWETRLY